MVNSQQLPVPGAWERRAVLCSSTDGQSADVCSSPECLLEARTMPDYRLRQCKSIHLTLSPSHANVNRPVEHGAAQAVGNHLISPPDNGVREWGGTAETCQRQRTCGTQPGGPRSPPAAALAPVSASRRHSPHGHAGPATVLIH